MHNTNTHTTFVVLSPFFGSRPGTAKSLCRFSTSFQVRTNMESAPHSVDDVFVDSVLDLAN